MLFNHINIAFDYNYFLCLHVHKYPSLTNFNSCLILSVLAANWKISPHSSPYCCGHKPTSYFNYNREFTVFVSSLSFLKFVLHNLFL